MTCPDCGCEHEGTDGYRALCPACSHKRRQAREAKKERPKCSSPGCERPSESRGLCGTHHRQVLRGTYGRPRAQRGDLTTSIESRWNYLTDSVLAYIEAETDKEYLDACDRLSDAARKWTYVPDALKLPTREVDSRLRAYLSGSPSTPLSTHGTHEEGARGPA